MSSTSIGSCQSFRRLAWIVEAARAAKQGSATAETLLEGARVRNAQGLYNLDTEPVATGWVRLPCPPPTKHAGSTHRRSSPMMPNTYR